MNARHAPASTGDQMRGQPDEIPNIDEVSMCLKVGKQTVCRLVSRGNIPGFKLDDTRRFRRAELDRRIASRIGKVVDDDAEEGLE